MLLLKLLKSVFITWNKGKIKYTYILDEYIYLFFLKLILEMLPWQLTEMNEKLKNYNY